MDFLITCLVALVFTLILFRNWQIKEIADYLIWLPWILQAHICKRKIPKLFNCGHRGISEYDNCGLVPTSIDVDLETNKNKKDRQLFFMGADSYGTFICIYVEFHNRKAETWMVIHKDLNSPLIYTATANIEESATSWLIGNLFLEILEPMRSWRIAFNGSTRSKGGDLVHTKLNVIWRCLKAPFNYWTSMGAATLAKNIWKSGLTWHELKTSIENEYQQWGVMHGHLTVGKNETQFVYLRGARSSSNIKSSSLIENTNAIIYGKGGNLIGFTENTLQSGKKLHSGYIQTSNGLFLEIFPYYDDRSYNYPSENDVQFQANGQIYSMDELMTNLIVSPMISKGKFHLYVNFHNNEWSLVMKRNFLQPESLETSSFRGFNEEVAFVISLCESQCENPCVSGGKGSSLAVLKKLGLESSKFSVPQGIVVTTLAWQHHYSSNKNIIESIQNIQKNVTSLSSMEDSCRKSVIAIGNSVVCESLKNDIIKLLESQFGSYLSIKRFAVRSSACGEDSSEASSAGQNETVLGCSYTSKDSNIFQSLLTCWASQFSFRSVEYRRQRGQPLSPGMAVVIQEMVDATEAGVVFTEDPITKDSGKLLITANYGLGETVVSATSDPDVITILKHDTKTVFSAQIGEKMTKCVMKDDGTTENIDVESSNAGKLCLSNAKLFRLAKVAILIEEKYGSSRDIEFAFKDEDLFLLQSRPITSQFEPTDYEIYHEYDSALLTDDERTSFSNIGEVLPTSSTPLTLSILPKVLDLGVQTSNSYIEWPFYKIDTYAMYPVCLAFNRCMMNMSEMLYRGVAKKLSMITKTVDLAVCGKLVTNSEVHEWVLNRYGAVKPLANILRNFCLLLDLINNQWNIKKWRKMYSNYNLSVGSTTASGAYKEICCKLTDFIEIINIHLSTSRGSTASQCIALIILTSGKEDITPDVIQNIGLLFSCITDTESGSVPTDLEALCDSILMNSKEADQFINKTPKDANYWLENSQSKPSELYRNFMKRHGHRGICEFELRYASWAQEPEKFVQTIQQLTKARKTVESIKIRKSVNEVLEELNDLTASNKRALRVVMKLCSSCVQLREATKSMSIRVISEIKKLYKHLGKLMVEEFRLPDEDLIYFLSHYEIDCLLKNRSASLVVKASRRRRIYPSLCKQEFPEFSVGLVKPIESNKNNVPLSSNEKMYGTPVFCGAVEGPARVVTSLDDASTIKNGDILITHCTDVGWTPYFPLLAGIVTEIGGLISHGAVVAREYGLPCVVGLKGATQKIKSGDIVLLNAKDGYLQKL